MNFAGARTRPACIGPRHGIPFEEAAAVYGDPLLLTNPHSHVQTLKPQPIAISSYTLYLTVALHALDFQENLYR